MSDEYSRSELTLGAALRALPTASPNGDVWSELAAKLAPPARARRARFVWPAALAACVLLAVVAVLMRYHAPTAATVAGTSPSSVGNATVEAANVTDKNLNDANVANGTNTHLVALQTRSRELEQWLHETADAATPLPGNDLAAAGEIESLIGIVDVELAAPKQRDEDKLWQRRVHLLEDLTALRYSNYRLAESSTAANAGQPGTWIN
jgi:hypothetical protein